VEVTPCQLKVPPLAPSAVAGLMFDEGYSSFIHWRFASPLIWYRESFIGLPNSDASGLRFEKPELSIRRI